VIGLFAVVDREGGRLFSGEIIVRVSDDWMFRFRGA
jgi:hypothetical protein